MIKFRSIISILLIHSAFCLKSQTLMSPQEAVGISLQNNYGILLAKNAKIIAENNTSYLNTGELPNVRFNSGVNYGVNGSELNYNDNNIPSSSTWVTNGVDYNAGISADYLIYDFGGRKLNKEKLTELLHSAELSERLAMELNILGTLISYYNIAQIQENVYAQEEVLNISRERKERAEYQFEFGKTNKLSVLNAEVDINRDSIDYLNLIQQLENEKRDLNLLLGRDVDTAFEIDTSISFKNDLGFDQLVVSSLSTNTEILLTQKDREISELERKINDTALKPRISASSSLGLFGGVNDNKPAVSNQFGSDFAAGVSLSWNIFDGGSSKIRDKNLHIAIENQEMLLEQQKKEVLKSLKNSWTSYKNQLYIMKVEASNMETSKLNFERTQEQFRLGLVSSVEFRQAQLNQLVARVNYNRARFIAKTNELNLLQLSGQLLNEF